MSLKEKKWPRKIYYKLTDLVSRFFEKLTVKLT